MLDVFIFIGTFLALFFVIVGQKWFSGWAFFISAVLFLVIGMGVFVTGWETQSKSPILIQDINASAQQITFEVNRFAPDLGGDPVSQLVYTIAVFYIGLSLVFIFLAIQQGTKNRDAKKVSEE